MKIIRWLLSHSLFILLIVVVIYAYMFWGNLLGEDTPAGKTLAYLSDEFVEVKEFVDAVKAKQAELSEEKSQNQPAADALIETSESASLEATQVNLDENRPTENITESTAAEARAAEPHAAETRPAAARADDHNQARSFGYSSGYSTVQPMTKSVSTSATATSVARQQSESASGRRNNLPATAVTGNDSAKTAAANYPRAAAPGMQSAAAPVTNSGNTGVNTMASAQPSTLPNSQATAPPAARASTPGKAFADAAYAANQGGFVPVEVERQLSNVDSHGEVIDPSQPSGSVKELWITARKSYYQRDYALSEKSYLEVIDRTKNNYDAYGELGNVYFNQGKNKEAASAYFEAAAILINKGQVNRARSLLGLMRHLDEAKARELQQLIDAAKS